MSGESAVDACRLELGAPDSNWQELKEVSPFTRLVGPFFYQTRIGLANEEAVRHGMRVVEKHCNKRQVCHGGMLASFLDVALARCGSIGLGVTGSMPTISMSIDYLQPARVGDWIESRVAILHRSHRSAFVQGVLVRDQAPLLRGSGVFRLPKNETL
jgi:uncharacterized protein (TIGR00369 family)